MEQEDAIVVNPPQELETNNESELTPVDGPRGTADARTGTEPQAQRTYTFTKHDIKAIANEALQEAIDKGEFDDIVEANPTLEGSEPDLESLKVGPTKYKVGGGTNVIANPTLAGTEATLEGLQIGNTKYKAGGGTPVEANPTWNSSNPDLNSIKIGDTTYKTNSRHCYAVSFCTFNAGWVDYSEKVIILYYTDNENILNDAAFIKDVYDNWFRNSNSAYKVASAFFPSAQGKMTRIVRFFATSKTNLIIEGDIVTLGENGWTFSALIQLDLSANGGFHVMNNVKKIY